MAVLSDKQFAANTLANGGATRNLHTGEEVSLGQNAWAVGRAPNDKGKAVPESSYPAAGYTSAQVREHRKMLQSQVSDPDAHQGSWVENGSVVNDASSVFRGPGSKGKALLAGYARGERAVFGFEHGKDRNLGRRAIH